MRPESNLICELNWKRRSSVVIIFMCSMRTKLHLSGRKSRMHASSSISVRFLLRAYFAIIDPWLPESSTGSAQICDFTIRQRSKQRWI